MIDYSFEKSVRPQQLQALLRQTTWANGRGIDGIRAMLAGSAIFLGAWDGDRLIGFCRAVTDGIYRALIDDVVVDAPQRGRGIGSALMRKLSERLKEMEVEEIFLRCENAVVPFYGQLGFKSSDGVTMDLDL